MVWEKESDEATWWHTRRVDSAQNSAYVCEHERTRVSSPVHPIDESPVFLSMDQSSPPESVQQTQM